MATVLVIAVVVYALLHLGSGLHRHRRYRRAGLSPRLYWSLGRGFYGSARIPGTGFRVSHRL